MMIFLYYKYLMLVILNAELIILLIFSFFFSQSHVSPQIFDAYMTYFVYPYNLGYGNFLSLQCSEFDMDSK